MKSRISYSYSPNSAFSSAIHPVAANVFIRTSLTQIRPVVPSAFGRRHVSYRKTRALQSLVSTLTSCSYSAPQDWASLVWLAVDVLSTALSAFPESSTQLASPPVPANSLLPSFLHFTSLRQVPPDSDSSLVSSCWPFFPRLQRRHQSRLLPSFMPQAIYYFSPSYYNCSSDSSFAVRICSERLNRFHALLLPGTVVERLAFRVDTKPAPAQHEIDATSVGQ